VVPLRSTEAQLGERRYSSNSFLTSAREGGEWSASRPGRALPPGKQPSVPIVQEAGWVPEPVWTQGLEEKSSASDGDRTPAVQSVVRHYTDWATRLILCGYLNKVTEIRFSTEYTVSPETVQKSEQLNAVTANLRFICSYCSKQKQFLFNQCL
jgi:hypothetical protein